MVNIILNLLGLVVFHKKEVDRKFITQQHRDKLKDGYCKK